MTIADPVKLDNLPAGAPAGPPFAKEDRVTGLWRKTAQAFPDRTAMERNDRHLSYGALAAQVDRVAGLLVESGPGSVVAVLVDDPWRAAIGLLACLRAGVAFAPLDADAPPARLNLLVRELEPRLLLAEAATADRAARLALETAEPATVVTLPEGPALTEPPEAPATFPDPPFAPDGMCYIYFTSGSTGVPKGIAGRFKGLSQFVKWEIETFEIGPDIRVSQFTHHGFDAFLRDVLVPLCAGGTLCLPPDRPVFLEPERLRAWVDERGLNLVHCVPTLFRVLAGNPRPDRFRALRWVLLAGEELQVEDVRLWLETHGDRGRLVNFYGSTETTMIKFYHVVGAADLALGFIPIGKPMKGARAVLLDGEGNVCPPGVVGELYIRSPNMTLGYYRDPELTDRVFVPNPFGANPDERIFRTGDMARILDNGAYQFVGRRDNLVKIRGLRIELGEVEHHLRQLNGVAGAVATLRTDRPGEALLTAYVIPDGESDLGADRMRRLLEDRLPDYMIPNAFVFLDEFPLTPNGKIDRRALPAPDPGPGDGAEVNLPRNPVEELLAAVWAEVLHLPEIDIHANFFAMGGHSLLATQVLARLREVFGVDLSLRTLFRAPTVAALGRAVQSALAEDGTGPMPPPVPVPRGGYLPLSFAQQRLWFLAELDPGSFAYNMPAAVAHEGGLAAKWAETAFHRVASRHEVLRTTIEARDGAPGQIVHEDRAPVLELVDLGGLSPLVLEQHVQVLAETEARIPFRLGSQLPLRVKLLRRTETRHVVLFTLHHIAGDAWSMDILLREFLAFYQGELDGRKPELQPLPVQYADYAVWQRGWLQGEVLIRELDFWKTRLGSGRDALALPTDRPRPAVRSLRGARLPVRIEPEVATALRDLSRKRDATPFMTLLAAFQTLLWRHARQDDFNVGVPVAGRTTKETEGLIGFFVNTLVMPADLSGDPTFTELILRVRETALEAFAHGEVPFEKLVDELAPRRAVSHSPLFQVMFVLNNLAAAETRSGNPGLRLLEVERGTAKFDLTLFLLDSAHGLSGSFEYDSELFDRTTVQRWAKRFNVLLRAIVAEPESRLSRFSLLTPGEGHALLVQWNDTREAFGGPCFAHLQFERTVTAFPDAVAVIMGRCQRTYDALNRGANRLAHALRGLGVKPESPVALCLERSADVIPAILGIFKAGGVYVPMDPDYPEARLAQMTADCRAPVVVTESRVATRLPTGDATIFCRDTHAARIASMPDRNPANLGHPENLAYIIFTSGSTGRAKAIAIAHRGLANLACVERAFLGTGPNDRVLQFFSFSFDASLWDVLMGLGCGGALYVASHGERLSSLELADLLLARQITAITLPPSILATFPETRLPALRTITATGEACSASLVERWAGTCTFVNGYGPTETTIGTTLHRCRPDETQASIGRPWSNMKALVLDPDLFPQPIGTPGELAAGGVGLARGYLKRPDLTAAVFVPHPNAELPGERIYRTGDLGRVLANGELAFMGRIDHQVKVRGFRVELGEVETVLGRHPAIKEAAVVARDGDRGLKRLIAYCVPEKTAPEPRDLRTHLKERLPEYMMPAVFVMLTRFPRTPSGKVDRNALPEPVPERPELGAAFAAPRNEPERKLARIWAGVLGLERVGIHDNFFELGGDSILSIQVAARAQRAGLHLTTRQLFQHQTVAELAVQASTVAVARAEQETLTGPVPLSPIQCWFFNNQKREPFHFNQSVFLQAETPLNQAALAAAVEGLVRHHDALRLRFTEADGEWHAAMAGPGAHDVCCRVDLREISARHRRMFLETAAQACQRSLDLSAGPLFRAVLFQLGDGEPDRLLLIGHHLVVDGVSWRILLEDFRQLYRAAITGEPGGLPPKTTSFRAWSKLLRDRAAGPDLRKEMPYWTEALRHRTASPIPDRETGANDMASAKTLTVRLKAEETEDLLRKTPAAYRTRIDDMLLTALARAVCGRWGGDSLLVDMERHGRDGLEADVDLSRTVGWFTASYPVCLPVAQGEPPWETLLRTKEILRDLPSQGLGFGMLRYLSEDTEVRGTMARLPAAGISFNYLGQFDRVLGGDMPFRLASESAGVGRSGLGARPHLLAVDGAVVGGRLRLSWDFSANRHDRATVAALADAVLAELRDLIGHCLSNGAGGYSPSDFPLSGLGRDSLKKLYAAHPRLEDVYPLTPMQQGMWFHSLFDDRGSVYCAQTRCRLRGPLDAGAFSRAWQWLMARYAVLRTSFWWLELGSPVQVVHRSLPDPIAFCDVRGLPPARIAAVTDALAAGNERLGFDPARPPLIRVNLVRTGDDRHELVASFHHLLMDGWSWPLVMRDLFRAYVAFSEGALPRAEPVAPYRNYLGWLAGRDLAAAESYWRETLAGMTAPTPLPGECPVTVAGQQDYRELRLDLGKAQTRALTSFARARKLTLNTLVQGAWARLLACYSGEEKVVFGSVVSGRPAELAGVESMVGNLINTLPVRIGMPGSMPRSQWLAGLQRQQVGMRDFEYGSLVQIQGWSEVPRDRPLFESILIFENYPVGDAVRGQGGPLAIGGVESRERTHYPLALIAVPADRLALRLGFRTDRFAPTAVRRLLAELETLLTGLVEAPDRTIGEWQPLSDAAKHRLLLAWNDSRGAVPRGVAAYRWFSGWVARAPEKVAVCRGSIQLTYGFLDRDAGRTAGVLHRAGAGVETPVGLCLERGPRWVRGFLGILRSGACYLPLDPAYPSDRLRIMVEDARPRLVLTRPGLQDRLDRAGIRATTLGDLEKDDLRDTRSSGVSPVRDEHPAYIIFTSGSTGRPKGVVVSHGGLGNLVAAQRHTFGNGPADRVLQFSSAGFDASVFELAMALFAGAALVIPEGAALLPGTALMNLMREAWVTNATLPPAALSAMRDGLPGNKGLPALSTLVSAGESVSGPAVDRWSPGRSFFNCYGPTETTIWASAEHCRPGWAAPPIGRPVTNTRLYLLDRCFRPAPAGAQAELCIGGRGTARGYLRRPDLTADRFVPDPFAGEPGGRLYRSGDIARFHDDGRLLFAGRDDGQVKIRGFRVELGEVEHVLARCPGVMESAVAARPDASGAMGLVGYLVPPESSEVPDLDPIREHLRKALPEYMVPTRFTVLDDMPLNASGKIDRKALPDPVTGASGRAPAPPRDMLEWRIHQIFREVLDVENPGVNANFFDLGGHSLLAINLVDRLNRYFGRAFTLPTLFRNPTASAMAAVLRRADAPAERHRMVRLREGIGSPWFWVHASSGSIFPYEPLARAMDGSRPFYAFHARGLEGEVPPLDSIEAMAELYSRELQAFYPEGTLFLGGWSLGGAVALEMARLLRAHGRKVASLVLIEGSLPSEVAGGTDDCMLFQAFAKDLGLSLPRGWADLPREKLFAALTRAAGEAGGHAFDIARLERAFTVFRANVNALEAYRPRTVDVDAVLVHSPDYSEANRDRWAALTRQVTLLEVTGDHYSLLQPPSVTEIAKALAELAE